MDLTKLGMCIDFVHIWFGIANGQISSTSDKLFAHHMIMVGYYCLTFLFIFQSKSIDSLLISHENICCGYSLEASH